MRYLKIGGVVLLCLLCVGLLAGITVNHVVMKRFTAFTHEKIDPAMATNEEEIKGLLEMYKSYAGITIRYLSLHSVTDSKKETIFRTFGNRLARIDEHIESGLPYIDLIGKTGELYQEMMHAVFKGCSYLRERKENPRESMVRIGMNLRAAPSRIPSQKYMRSVEGALSDKRDPDEAWIRLVGLFSVALEEYQFEHDLPPEEPLDREAFRRNILHFANNFQAGAANKAINEDRLHIKSISIPYEGGTQSGYAIALKGNGTWIFDSNFHKLTSVQSTSPRPPWPAWAQ